MESIRISTLLFYMTTWGYFLSGFFVAWIPQISIPSLLIRDSWVFILPIYLIFRKQYITCGIMFFLWIIGLVTLIERFDVPALMCAFYGIRDLSLYFLLYSLLNDNSVFSITERSIRFFVLTILILSCVQIIANIFNVSFFEDIFRTKQYFANKGVESNLTTGILGNRLSVPLYSSALLCTLFSVFYFFDKKIKSNRFERFLGLVASIFTVSKVLPLVLFFKLLGKYWKVLIIFSSVFITAVLVWLNSFRQTLETGFWSYHLASTFKHIRAFAYAAEIGLFQLVPSLIGSHSVLGKNFLGSGDNSYTIESSLLSRVLDLKVFSVVFILFLIWPLFTWKNVVKSRFWAMFLVIMSLTATSNHPIVYVPFIFYINRKKDMNC